MESSTVPVVVKGYLRLNALLSSGNITTSAATNDSKFCLKQLDGELRLDHRHAYYYQVQTQLFVCDVEYADFCVSTF